MKPNLEQVRDKARQEEFKRSFDINRSDDGVIDEEARTVSVAFSSDEPYGRWFGDEILDHSPSSVRLGRLENSGAVLVDHNHRDMVGVVESVSLDKDQRGRALVRFGKSDRASEIFQDVVDGIRTKISVGYRVHEMVLEKSTDDGDVYRVTDWEPFEISFVSVPADDSVGVGRGHEQFVLSEEEDPDMDPKGKKKSTDGGDGGAPAVQVTSEELDAQRKQARADELGRIREINAIAEEFECGAKAQEAIENGDSIDVFRQTVLGEVAARGGHKPGAIADVGLDEKDLNNYSFLRAFAAAAYPNDQAIQNAAGFEKEVSQEAAKRSDTQPQGILIPPEVLARDLNVGTPGAGGNLVATDLLSGGFIELLRNRSVFAQMGITVLDGLVGNVSIPKQTGAATAYWIDTEGNAPTESQQTVGQVAFTPKTLGAFTDFTRQFLMQSSISAEMFVRNDLTRVIALAVDLAIMYGSGAAGQPTGIVNQAGIGSVSFSAANPTFGEIVNLESEVAADNADVGTLGYAFNAAMRGHFKQTEKAEGTAQFIWESGNTINGHETAVSNQMTAGDVVFGNFADAVLALWGGLDLMIDPYTQSTSGGTRVVALQSVDTNVRNVESFALGNDG